MIGYLKNPNHLNEVGYKPICKSNEIFEFSKSIINHFKMELKATTINKYILFVLIQLGCIYTLSAQKKDEKTLEKEFKILMNLKAKHYPKMNDDSPFFFNEKPLNESENHCYMTLSRFLYEDVPLITVDSSTNRSKLFLFRVNQFGEIDFLETFGDLDSTIEQKIISNIYRTQGRWTLPKKSSRLQQRYFLFKFSERDYRSSLPDSIKQKTYSLAILVTLLRNLTSTKNSNLILLLEGSLYREMVRKGIVSVEEL